MTSRILENIQSDMARWNAIGYCIASASLDDAQRADFKHRDGNGAENWQRTKRMKLILQRSPFAYKKVWGEYEGNSEVSYAIFPVSKDGEKIPFDKLETFAKSLGKCFQQDTVLIRKPDEVGGDTYYVNAASGEKDMEFDNLSFEVDPASDFSTNTRNPKKLSHKNHYFKYESLNDKGERMTEEVDYDELADRFDYTDKWDDESYPFEDSDIHLAGIAESPDDEDFEDFGLDDDIDIEDEAYWADAREIDPSEFENTWTNAASDEEIVTWDDDDLDAHRAAFGRKLDIDSGIDKNPVRITDDWDEEEFTDTYDTSLMEDEFQDYSVDPEGYEE